MMVQGSKTRKWTLPEKFSWFYLLIFAIDLLPGTGNMMAITMLVFSLFDTMLLESWLIVL